MWAASGSRPAAAAGAALTARAVPAPILPWEDIVRGVEGERKQKALQQHAAASPPPNTHTHTVQGYGTLLMAEAERIARAEHRSDKLFVISGVGTRHYYRCGGAGRGGAGGGATLLLCLAQLLRPTHPPPWVQQAGLPPGGALHGQGTAIAPRRRAAPRPGRLPPRGLAPPGAPQDSAAHSLAALLVYPRLLSPPLLPSAAPAPPSGTLAPVRSVTR